MSPHRIAESSEIESSHGPASSRGNEASVLGITISTTSAVLATVDLEAAMVTEKLGYDTPCVDSAFRSCDCLDTAGSGDAQFEFLS